MQNELKKSNKLEKIYLEIKKITAQTDLDSIVYKILNRNKTYNLRTAKVTEKEKIIESLKSDINNLKETYAKVKEEGNDNCKYKSKAYTSCNNIQFEGEDVKKKPESSPSKKRIEQIAPFEEYSQEEIELMEHLNQQRKLQEKVKLKYEQVILNIEQLVVIKNNIENTRGSKMDDLTPLKKRSLTRNPDSKVTTELNTTGLTRSLNTSTTRINDDEKILMSYFQYLERLTKDVDSLFLSVITFDNKI